MLNRQCKGRMWNIETDNNTSIWDSPGWEQLENHYKCAAHACLALPVHKRMSE